MLSRTEDKNVVRLNFGATPPVVRCRWPTEPWLWYGGGGGAGTPAGQAAAAVCSRRPRTAHVRPAREPNVSRRRRRRRRRPLVSIIYIHIYIFYLIVNTKATDLRGRGATISSTYTNETRPYIHIIISIITTLLLIIFCHRFGDFL